MRQFYSPRTRLFFKPASRFGFRLRHVAVLLCSVAVISAGIHFMAKVEAPDLSGDTLALATPAYVSKPLPSVPNTDAPVAAHASLKSAFDLTPVPASHEYAARQEETAAAVIKTPTVTPEQSKELGRSLAFIQQGISNILQAGSNMLVSTKTVAVGKGDTLMELLVRNNVPRNEAHEAIMALSKIYDPRDLNPGHEIKVFFHQDPSVADPKFSGLAIEKDVISTVTVNKSDDGSFTAGEQEKTVSRNLRAFDAEINSSLYVSAKATGVPDAVILDLIKMYSWNVDFQRDIQSGDRFEVMYEEYKTETGDVVRGKGDIVYAKLTLSGQDLPFYRYEASNGDVDYFDETGRSAKRPLMKTPIDGARLSSGFGMRRHPVLGYSKMHKGVDFAAPRGTPIYAAGDGTIERLGKFSSYGNYISIRHKGNIKTAYAHLNGYKAGLKAGSRVKQGQVIGYVGSTGRSTGPHLHYEVIVAGKQVNPNSIKLPTGTMLAGKELARFKSAVSDLNRAFANAGKPAAVASAAN